MTESADRKSFEERAVRMMYDPSLDDFNRGLCFLLLNTYIHRLPDTNEANAIVEKIKQDNTLPSTDHVGIAIRKMEFVKEKKKRE